MTLVVRPVVRSQWYAPLQRPLNRKVRPRTPEVPLYCGRVVPRDAVAINAQWCCTPVMALMPHVGSLLPMPPATVARSLRDPRRVHESFNLEKRVPITPEPGALTPPQRTQPGGFTSAHCGTGTRCGGQWQPARRATGSIVRLGLGVGRGVYTGSFTGKRLSQTMTRVNSESVPAVSDVQPTEAAIDIGATEPRSGRGPRT